MTPEPQPDPLDEVFAALRRQNVPPLPVGADATVLARLADGPVPAAAAPSNRWRTIMRIASWSLAASVLAVAGTLVLFGGSASVALADVIKAAEQYKLLKYKTSETADTKEGSSPHAKEGVTYADLKAPRLRQEQRVRGHLSGAIDFEVIDITDTRKNVVLHILAETVTEKGKTDPALIELLKGFEKQGVPRQEATMRRAHSGNEPAGRRLTVLEHLRDLERHKDAVASKSKLGGKDVLKYRIEEGNKTTTLWVDAATKLPVRMEHEIDNFTDQTPRLKFVTSDYEWDPPVPGGKTLDAFFSTTPPAGYKVTDLIKNPPK